MLECKKYTLKELAEIFNYSYGSIRVQKEVFLRDLALYALYHLENGKVVVDTVLRQPTPRPKELAKEYVNYLNYDVEGQILIYPPAIAAALIAKYEYDVPQKSYLTKVIKDRIKEDYPEEEYVYTNQISKLPINGNYGKVEYLNESDYEKLSNFNRNQRFKENMEKTMNQRFEGSGAPYISATAGKWAKLQKILPGYQFICRSKGMSFVIKKKEEL